MQLKGFLCPFRGHPRSRAASRILATSLGALLLALTLLPLLGQQVSATFCAPGYKPGPDTEVVNADGSITRIPGPCVPIGGINLGNVDPDVLDNLEDAVNPDTNQIDPNQVDPAVLDTIAEAINGDEIDMENVDLAVLDGHNEAINNGEIDVTELDPEVLDALNEAVNGGIDLAEVNPHVLQNLNHLINGGLIDLSGIDPDVLDALNDAIQDALDEGTDDCELPPCGTGDGGSDPVGNNGDGENGGCELPPCGSGDGGADPVGGTNSGETNPVAGTTGAAGTGGNAIETGKAGVPDDSGTVVVAAFTCPVGVQVAGTDHGDYLAACTKETSRSGFAVRQIASVAQIIVAEQIPAGYGTPVVFCGKTQGVIGNAPTAVAPIAVVDGTVSLDLPPGSRIACDWFNLPASAA